MKIYKNNSNPLVEVPLYELVDREVYITEDGMRVAFKEEENSFDIIQVSELNLGHHVEDLHPGPRPNALGLYWQLMEYYKDKKKVR